MDLLNISLSLCIMDEKHLISGRWSVSKLRVRCCGWVFLYFVTFCVFAYLFLCVFPLQWEVKGL